MDEKYLLDADVFITPHQFYYNFAIAPGFWAQLNDHSSARRIFTIDSVDRELRPENEEDKKDDLQLWIENEYEGNVINIRNEKILGKYREILQYLQKSDLYSEKAIYEWANINVADPWIIAAAIAGQFTVVTFEKHNPSINSSKPSSEVKIPNICKVFGVRCIDLFQMMKELEIKLQ